MQELNLDGAGLLGLLDTPPMPYARCRGMHAVYDDAAAGDPAAQKQALEICAHCPHLVECKRWVTESVTPRQRVALGVVGGRCYAQTHAQRKAQRAAIEAARAAARSKAAATAGARTGQTPGQDRRTATKPATVDREHRRVQRAAQRAAQRRETEAARAARRARRSTRTAS
jgi:hypothetical protein